MHAVACWFRVAGGIGPASNGETCTLLPQIVGDDAVNHGNAERGCREMTQKQDAEERPCSL